MAEQSALVTDVILEDKIADIWPDYPCLYDVASPDFKNRDMREKSFHEIAEKVQKTGKTTLFQYNLISHQTNFRKIIAQSAFSAVLFLFYLIFCSRLDESQIKGTTK